MKVRVARARELGPAEWSRWSDLQRANRSLASPFFSPEFTQAIAEAQPNATIGVLESRGGIDGFFPFQSAPDGAGLPIAPRLSDYQGVIAGEGLTFDSRELIAGCRLTSWSFDHVPAAQTAFEPHATSRSQSPQIDLTVGFETYMRTRPQAGVRPFRRLADLKRQLAREVGPLRFCFSNRNRDDLDILFQLKSEQYARTKSAPVLQLPEIRAALDALWPAAGPDFSTVFSTLHAGDALVAAHLGLRTGTTLHWWLPTYDRGFARYSPGLLLLLSLAEEANGAGIDVIDLGKGTERYKRRFANRSVELLQGSVNTLTPALTELRATWDAFGSGDPLWAICMRPDCKYDTWDRDEFFASGESELAADLQHLDSLGVSIGSTRALDFGCGIGRVTRPLSRRFDHVIGVDVSPRLIAEARHLDAANARAVYLEQTREDLSAFPDGSFDFVYCCNVLQTMPAQLGLQYVREFMRVVHPGGVVLFQVPVEFRDLPFHFPSDACLADVSATIPAAPFCAGQSIRLPVTVRNISAHRWPASFCDGRSQDLRVGNHWLDGAGAILAADDGRSHLPQPLRPGESITVPLTVTAPSVPGVYELQIDLVIEQVAWFGARGSHVHSVMVEVSAADSETVHRDDPMLDPAMTTSVLPLTMIEQAVSDGEGRIVDAREDPRSGRVWKSLEFVVVKQPRALS